MKIAVVTARLPFGSGEAFLLPEIWALIELGHSVRVVPTRTGGKVLHAEAARLIERGHVFVPPMVSRLMPAAVPRDLRGVRPKVKVKNALAAPVGRWAGEMSATWRADHIHACWASTPASVALIAGQIASVGWSFTMHRWDIHEDNALAAKLDRACFARAISVRGAAEVEARVGRNDVRRLNVGVNLVDGGPRPVSGSRLLVPASLLPVKGHAVLLEALRNLPDVMVDLVGDGPSRRSLVRDAIRSGIRDRVHFLGVVPHDVLLRRMRTTPYAAVVLPSLRISETLQEGIPVALVEAMSAGIPVISTLSGAVPELLGDDRGLLVEPGNVDALARAIASVLADPSSAGERAGKARLFVAAHHDARRVATQLIDWMHECGGL